ELHIADTLDAGAGLCNLESSNVDVVGNKSANLRELALMDGISIPKGFTVKTAVFETYIKGLGLLESIRELDSLSREWARTEEKSPERANIEKKLDELSERIRLRIVNGDVDLVTQQEIVSAYKALLLEGENGLVAVRSSATAEDMPKASFAGQYTSLLNVHGGHDLIQAVKAVWASTFSANAVKYRNQHGLKHEKTNMAVLILEMVQAETAGTAFSVDVRTGMPMLMINNTYGLGEAEVAGKVSSDTWIVDPIAMTVLSRQLGSKSIRMIYDEKKEANVDVENSPQDQERFAIDTKAALAIAGKLKIIHDHFLKKKDVKFVDIEYAIRANGDIVLLQARPATSGETKLAIVNQKSLKAYEKEKKTNFPVILQGGITGAIGVVTGVVRVVSSLEEAQDRIKPGDILVTANTMSYWEKVMGVAGGMITSIGGPGNHTAVVAREEGKPAIVGNGQAIDVLKAYDGKVVTIDALLKKVYLGVIPQECILTPASPDEIPTEYGGLDNVSYEEAWEGATKVKQTIQDPDGKQWMGKPNERTSRFLQEVHRSSHKWMASVAGLNVPVDRVQNEVYQTYNPDIYGWNVSLRSWTLEQIEEMYGVWVQTINDYGYNTQRLEINEGSIRSWIESFIHLNGIMNLAFPLNQVTAGWREQAFAKKEIKEPYLSLVRAASGQFRETLANEDLREYSKLYEILKKEAESHGSLPSILQYLIEGETDFALERLKAKYPEFYKKMENYINNFRVTNEFALSMTALLPWGRIARNLLKDLRSERKIAVSEPSFEEFYPEDKKFGKVVRLSALSAKLKQDSHHLKFRGQRRFMQVIRPFGDFLVSKGEIREMDEMFDHEPEWLLAMLNKYDRDVDFRLLKIAKSFDFRPYRLYAEHSLMAGQDIRSLRLRGDIHSVQKQAQDWGLPTTYLRNLSTAYDEAVQIFSKRHPGGANVWTAKRWQLRGSDLRSKAYLVNYFLHDFAMNADQTKIHGLVAAWTDLDEIFLFMGLSKEQQAEYLTTALYGSEKPNMAPMTLGGNYSLIDLFDSLEALHEVLQLMVHRGDLKPGDLVRWENAYVKRDGVSQLRESLNVVAGDKGTQRDQELLGLLESNLIYLFELWRDRNPDRDAQGFYTDLWEEAKRSGVAPVVVVLGSVNLKPENGSAADKVLFDKRAPIPSLGSTPVRYTYIGGGGYNATTIGRSVHYVMKEKGIGSAGYESVNIVSPFDTGGSSQKDADAVRLKTGLQIMSPGDMMSVMSFLTVSDQHLFSEEDEIGLKSSKHNPWDGEAIMDLLFTYTNRVTVPEDSSLENVLDQRIRKVNADSSLIKPDNWQEFVVNLKYAARRIDKELIEKGFLPGIRDEHTSVQNLLLMAFFLAHDMDFPAALRETNRMLGLRKALAIPASFEEAVMVMRLQTADGNTKREIVGHLNIVDDRSNYADANGDNEARSYQLFYRKKAGVGRDKESLAVPMLPSEYPKASPDAVSAIINTRRAVLMGMGSPFDSMLANLLLKDVITALKVKIKEGVPSIYFPKVLHETSSEGLSLKEVLELMERSIQAALEDESFRIESIISHVVKLMFHRI
ncbi:MAG: PEP/pyruvate-binding domain-containing protein, partial [Candidatus Omnitrophota bacterium]